jgi:DNA mismatch repair ATPase MutS
LQYRTESYNIFTNEFTRVLDERYGDICTDIIDIEDELIIDMESHIRNHSDEIRNVYRLLCEFDCMFAIAKVSRSLTRPQLSTNKLVILNGWHMLLGERSVNNHAFSIPFETPEETASNIY